MAKLVLDSFNGVLYADDRQIAHLSLMQFQEDVEEPFIYVTIRPSRLHENHQTIFGKDNSRFGVDVIEFVPPADAKGT